MRARRILPAVTIGVWCGTIAVAAATPPALRRDLGDYFLLASRTARVQDLQLESACNVGVNCAAPAGSSSCGELFLGSATFAEGSQVAGDRVFCTKPDASLWQLFSNGGTCGGVSIQIQPSQGFAPPIIAGTCAPGCVPDVEALEALCGFPEPFPACDAGSPVTVHADADCDGAADAAPGNGRCDLAPGAYGAIRVRNDGRLALGAGTYAACGLQLGRRAQVLGDATTLAIPSSYRVRLRGEARLGQQCGALTVLLDGQGAVTFGRDGSVAAQVCGPERKLHLGHGTTLTGRFVADTAVSGRGVRGLCCCDDCPD